MTSPRERYSRQILLSEVGHNGQEALFNSKVLCVGAGGLGSPVLLYLASAGVGCLGIIDGDVVDVTNLQRQILFQDASVGELKAKRACQNIAAQNPDVKCVGYPFDLTAANALEIVSEYDLVIDATDNFDAKFLINDVCAKLEKPWVYGSVSQWEGQVAAFFAKEGACYRCVYARPPQAPVGNCAENGVIGATVGVIGSLQAILALRILLPNTQAPFGTLQISNTLTGEQMKVHVAKNPACPVCHLKPANIEIANIDYISAENNQCKTAPTEIPNHPAHGAFGKINLAAPKIAAQKVLEQKDQYLALDVRTLKEWNTGHLPGAVHWPLSEIEKGHWPSDLMATLKAQNRKLLLYCQGGKRSEKAALILLQAGYSDVTELEGGVLAWPSALE